MPKKPSWVPSTLKRPATSDQDSSSSKRRKVERRHGACGSCRASKTRCDGEQPCGACRNGGKKRKICEYPKKAERLASQNKWIRSPSAYIWRGSQTVDRPPPVTELKMHKALLLHRVVDEFVDIRPTKGRGSQQITHIQELWSEFIKSGIINDTPLMETCQASSSNNNGAATPQERAVKWWADLDATMQLINTGKLTQAWKYITAVMREIECFYIEQDLMQQGSEAVSESTKPICLKLIDLECALSFFVGGSSQLTSWTQGRFLSAIIEQQKKADLLFATKLSLYHEIETVMQTDVSQNEGLWRFLKTVSEIRYALPAAELTKISLSERGDATVGMQELRLISHLCQVMLYCRTAVVSGHCVKESLPASSDDSSGEVVLQLHLSSPKTKSKDSHQAMQNARDVLHAFESLCNTDPEETAQNWFRLFGALTAATIVVIAELRDHGDETVKQQLSRIEACFKVLSIRNKSSPIFEVVAKILHQLGTENGSPVQVTDGEALPKGKKAKVSNCKKIKSDSITLPEKKQSLNIDHSNTNMMDEQPSPAEPATPHPIQDPDLEMTGSFNSTGSTFVEHSLLEGAPSSECRLYHFHPEETSLPPMSIWGHAPQLPHGDDWYWCACQHCSFRPSNGSTPIADTIPSVGQAYFRSPFDMSYQPCVTIPPADSFGICNTMIIDNSVQSAISYGLDGSTVFQMGSKWYPGPLSHAYEQQ